MVFISVSPPPRTDRPGAGAYRSEDSPVVRRQIAHVLDVQLHIGRVPVLSGCDVAGLPGSMCRDDDFGKFESGHRWSAELLAWRAADEVREPRREPHRQPSRHYHPPLFFRSDTPLSGALTSHDPSIALPPHYPTPLHLRARYPFAACRSSISQSLWRGTTRRSPRPPRRARARRRPPAMLSRARTQCQMRGTRRAALRRRAVCFACGTAAMATVMDPC
jgi:hypothetical protein